MARAGVPAAVRPEPLLLPLHRGPPPRQAPRRHGRGAFRCCFRWQMVVEVGCASSKGEESQLPPHSPHSPRPHHQTTTQPPEQAAGPEGDSGFAQRVLESVIISEAKNVEDQLFILTSKLPALLADPAYGIRLCVVDSMSALFRGEFSLARSDAFDRARLVFAMAKQMKKLAHDFRLPFVVTNQVGASVRRSVGGEGGRWEMEDGRWAVSPVKCVCSLIPPHPPDPIPPSPTKPQHR